MTHIRSREWTPPPEGAPSPTKAAWREGRLVARPELLELFGRVRTRQVEARAGVRYDRVRTERPVQPDRPDRPTRTVRPDRPEPQDGRPS